MPLIIPKNGVYSIVMNNGGGIIDVGWAEPQVSRHLKI